MEPNKDGIGRYLYRYEGYISSDLNKPRKYYIIKETEKGYWIAVGYVWNIEKYKGSRKWVSKEGKKRFAYADKKLALNNYIRRKISQLKHIDRIQGLAQKGLNIAVEMRKDRVHMEQDAEFLIEHSKNQYIG